MVKRTVMNNFVLSSLLAIYSFLLVSMKPWTRFSSSRILEVALPAYLAFIVLSGLIVCCIEWAANTTNRNKTEKVFLFLNGLYLIFGVALTRSYWTLGILKEPPFVDKIKNAAGLFFLGVLLPSGLFYYLFRKRKD